MVKFGHCCIFFLIYTGYPKAIFERRSIFQTIIFGIYIEFRFSDTSIYINHERGIKWDHMGNAQMQLDSFEVGQNSCPCYCNAGRQEWKGWWWAQGTWHSQVPLTDHVSSIRVYVECWSNRFGRLAYKLQILKFPSWGRFCGGWKIAVW